MSERDVRDSVASSPKPAPVPSIPRPTRVRIDPTVCAHYGTCLTLAPAALAGATPPEVRAGSSVPLVAVPATGPVLDAMSACPTGAIRWVEPREAVGEEAES